MLASENPFGLQVQVAFDSGGSWVKRVLIRSGIMVIKITF